MLEDYLITNRHNVKEETVLKSTSGWDNIYGRSGNGEKYLVDFLGVRDRISASALCRTEQKRCNNLFIHLVLIFIWIHNLVGTRYIIYS